MKPTPIRMTCAKCFKAYTTDMWRAISCGHARRDVKCECGAVGQWRLGRIEENFAS
jgi:hypothetical protein